MQLSRGELLKAYHQMRTIREFEERVHEEFSAGNIPGFVHLYAGEEASGVGFCTHLMDGDYIASTHRGHGHSIAKGCDTRGMMYEIFGRKEGLCGGKGGSMHIADLEKGMIGANGIVMNAGAGTVNIGALATHGVELGASQSWQNDSSSLLTVQSVANVSGSSTAFTLTLSGSGSGGTTINGIIADSGTVKTCAPD